VPRHIRENCAKRGEAWTAAEVYDTAGTATSRWVNHPLTPAAEADTTAEHVTPPPLTDLGGLSAAKIVGGNRRRLRDRVLKVKKGRS